MYQSQIQVEEFNIYAIISKSTQVDKLFNILRGLTFN